MAVSPWPLDDDPGQLESLGGEQSGLNVGEAPFHGEMVPLIDPWKEAVSQIEIHPSHLDSISRTLSGHSTRQTSVKLHVC